MHILKKIRKALVKSGQNSSLAKASGRLSLAICGLMTEKYMLMLKLIVLEQDRILNYHYRATPALGPQALVYEISACVSDQGPCSSVFRLHQNYRPIVQSKDRVRQPKL